MTVSDVEVRVRAVIHARWADTSDESYDAFMTSCRELQSVSSVAMAVARDLFHVGAPKERDAAADLVCRLDLDSPPDIHEAIYACLVEFLEAERNGNADSSVLAAVVYAFGHLNDPRAIPLLASLDHHESSEVRHAIASSLASAAEYEVNEQTTAAVDSLVMLSDDEDSDVRDWATFGLGQLEADTPAVRDALVRRMHDTDEDTRAEAFMALAQLRDERVVEPLLAELRRFEVGLLDVEAAGEFGDERFLPQLLEIAKWWRDENGDRETLEQAIHNCTPAS